MFHFSSEANMTISDFNENLWKYSLNHSLRKIVYFVSAFYMCILFLIWIWPKWRTSESSSKIKYVIFFIEVEIWLSQIFIEIWDSQSETVFKNQYLKMFDFKEIHNFVLYTFKTYSPEKTTILFSIFYKFYPSSAS